MLILSIFLTAIQHADAQMLPEIQHIFQTIIHNFSPKLEERGLQLVSKFSAQSQTIDTCD